MFRLCATLALCMDLFLMNSSFSCFFGDSLRFTTKSGQMKVNGDTLLNHEILVATVPGWREPPLRHTLYHFVLKTLGDAKKTQLHMSTGL